MDTIKFEIIKNDADQSSEANIYINDKNLVEILKEYELPFAIKEGHSNIAGGYMGRWPEELYEELSQSTEERKTILACGGCGEWGCWPMNITVVKEGGNVIWKNFEQPYRKEWDYSLFPVFRFNNEQYESELNKLNEK